MRTSAPLSAAALPPKVNRGVAGQGAGLGGCVFDREVGIRLRDELFNTVANFEQYFSSLPMPDISIVGLLTSRGNAASREPWS